MTFKGGEEFFHNVFTGPASTPGILPPERAEEALTGIRATGVPAAPAAKPGAAHGKGKGEPTEEDKRHAEELATLDVPGVFEQRQADHRAQLAATEAGLLRRALLSATRP